MFLHTLFKQVLPNVSVHSAEGIIKQVDVGVCVHRPSKVNPGLLTAGEGDAPLTD